jgi:hypothetical protein
MDKNTVNLAAAIVNDKRYSELKTAIYEELVKHDHATVVAVFRALQEYAGDANDNKFTESDVIQRPISVPEVPDFDPDLDDRLTPEEVSARK